MENEEITVLIVDDEQGIRDILGLNFEIEGFVIVKAAGGKEALEIVKKQRVDFVLSDVQMPEGDGFTLLKEIKKLELNLPTVLLVTGFAEVTRSEVIAAGGIDLLSKPPDIDQIVRIIKSSINHLKLVA